MKPGQQASPHPATTRRGRGVSADGEFLMPTHVFFGRGIADQAAARVTALGAGRVMLVTDPGVRAAGLADPIQDRLTAADVAVLAFEKVEPNPRDVDCLEGAVIAAEFQAEGLVAVGGGSAIDTAKCIALLRTNGGPSKTRAPRRIHETPTRPRSPRCSRASLPLNGM